MISLRSVVTKKLLKSSKEDKRTANIGCPPGERPLV